MWNFHVLKAPNKKGVLVKYQYNPEDRYKVEVEGEEVTVFVAFRMDESFLPVLINVANNQYIGPAAEYLQQFR